MSYVKHWEQNFLSGKLHIIKSTVAWQGEKVIVN